MFYFTYLRTFFREGVQRLPPHGHLHQEPWIQRTFSFPLASESNTALFSRRLWGCFSWNPIPRFTGNQHQAGRRVALPSRPGWQNPGSGKGQRLGQHGDRVPGERMKGSSWTWHSFGFLLKAALRTQTPPRRLVFRLVSRF